MWIHDVAGQVTDRAADVIFVLDESQSVTSSNFELIKSFLVSLVRLLDIDSGNTRVGLATVSANVDTDFDLNAHSTTTDVEAAISAVVYATGFTTNMHLALQHVRTTMLTATAGDRPDVRNVVLVASDGGWSDPANTQVCTVWKLMKNFLLISETILNL